MTTRTIQPWKERNNTENPWGEPVDFSYRVRGHREAGNYLATGLIEAGFDMPYALKPLHHPLAHAFKNTVLLLDDARTGFDYPLDPVPCELLWPAGQRGARACACRWRCAAGQGPRSALAQSRAAAWRWARRSRA